jgi:glutamyl-Q tRNA(Asp) synthetase
MAAAENPITTRFAPSPTGHLHLGHAYSALFAYRKAQENGGRFILRIEDIDPARCREVYAEQIFEDLKWLGLSWDEPVRFQSRHMDDYHQAISALVERGLLYPCFCTRKDIMAELKRMGHAPHGPEHSRYPGTCRALSTQQREKNIKAGKPFSLRLDMQEALRQVQNSPLTWVDEDKGVYEARPQEHGDVILARKDTPTSYHLCVVVDDALQGITHVTRSQDLLEATHLHRLLQALLDLPVPIYHHHRIIRDENGHRFSKRHKTGTLCSLRAQGKTAEDLYHSLI